jgi:hypothetical protein
MEQAQQVTCQEGIAPRQRGTLREAGQNLVRGQVRRVSAVRFPQLFVRRDELSIQLANDLVLVGKPVVEIPRADARARGDMIGRDRGTASFVEQLKGSRQDAHPGHI